MTLKFAVLIILTAVALQPGPAAAAVPPEFANRGCTFYNDPNGKGEAVKVNVQHPDGSNYNQIVPAIASSRDNKISAVRCDSHCSTALYDQPQRAGGEIAVIDGQAGFVSLVGGRADNKTSSLAVFCAR